MTFLSPLPVHTVLADVMAGLAHGAVVVVAPPGSGKTTVIPRALAEHFAAAAGHDLARDVVVLQPRRLAARLTATYVAQQRGEALGDFVGYEVRFERAVSERTRLRFVTEGVLTRRLLRDPQLRGTACVVLDEFHERHIHGDVALAHVRRLQATTRPDLRLVVMSATLDPGPLAAYLGDAPIITSHGRAFPVEIEHLPPPDDRPLGRQVVAAVQTLLRRELRGDVLVFLPGMAEIARAAGDLKELAARHDLRVLPLHGELTAAQQQAALGPSPQRKIILSTNVAETSITIDGVVAVIDSGLARILRQRSDGMSTLLIEPISQASAVQRAGRAGRTQPGHCVRLYSAHDFAMRRAFEAPEIARVDLAELVLELAGMGLDVARLPWFEAPPTAAVQAAIELLTRLGAVSQAGAEGAAHGDRDDAVRLTPLGAEMLPLPAHPRQARLALAARDAGLAAQGARLAALLGARDLRRERGRAQVASNSDLLDDLDVVEFAADRDAQAAARQTGVDAIALAAVMKAARQLQQALGGGGGGNRAASRAHLTADARDDALRRAILAAYPDRVAKRRRATREYLLAGGGSATLAEGSRVAGCEFIVAIDLQRRTTGGSVIHRGSGIDPAWLLDDLENVRESDEMVWQRERLRVERRETLAYGAVVISETQTSEGARRDPVAASRVLAEQALAVGLPRFVDKAALDAFLGRVAFAAGHAPQIAAPTPEVLAAALAQACAGLISFAELERADVLGLLRQAWGEHLALIDKLAPTHLPLPGRQRTPIHYEPDGRPPWVASRLQDFFGLSEPPRVAAGRVPLVVQLLAPNLRPVQITQDLPGFWQRHYPAIRKELMRKYPRHKWPENPMLRADDDAKK